MPFLSFALPLRKIRESCHFKVLLPTEKKIQVKMPFQSLASYSEEKSGIIAISEFCFLQRSEKNSGENAISEFCFLQ